ncbi:flagellin domain protein [Magnetococcus marinus MC-1]|uniref:Flagellin domain protein n=1 Tax=Magnetococcus marinus (strain ATCC BAA-1437 / JCM 17883 / MC-1) TaxID=156889 RepID=A0L3R2_MAGMM|nr:flagellin domain-containing protein [Magnetococcus marinus]ABK42605.1 flagellin domain protein [Magnetococcus marinus MC-1]
MGLTIYGNVFSLDAHRARSRRSDLSDRGTFKRLISRIEPDAGEPAVLDMLRDYRRANRLRTVNQARQNANAGISTIQVAEQALRETESALQRIQEITSRPLDGEPVEGSKRAKYDQEVAQLVRDIDGLAGESQRHSMRLMRGGLSSHSFAVGVDQPEEICFTVDDTSSAQMGVEASVAWDDPQLALDALANIHRAMNRVAQVRQELDQVHNRFNTVLERLSSLSEQALTERRGIESAQEAETVVAGLHSALSQQAEAAITMQANQHTMLVNLLLN